jgi:hypothetical protein
MREDFVKQAGPNPGVQRYQRHSSSTNDRALLLSAGAIRHVGSEYFGKENSGVDLYRGKDRRPDKRLNFFGCIREKFIRVLVYLVLWN